MTVNKDGNDVEQLELFSPPPKLVKLRTKKPKLPPRGKWRQYKGPLDPELTKAFYGHCVVCGYQTSARMDGEWCHPSCADDAA